MSNLGKRKLSIRTKDADDKQEQPAKAAKKAKTSGSSAFPDAPVIKWTKPGAGTIQALNQEFALLVQRNAKPAKAKVCSSDHEKWRVDVHVVEVSDGDESELDHHLDNAMLPLWVAGSISPNSSVTAADFAKAARAAGKDGALQGKEGISQVIDEGRKVKDGFHRNTNVQEFQRHIVNKQKAVRPLNWLNLSNTTGTRFTPDAIMRQSLVAILDEREGVAHKPMEFFLATTEGSLSMTHMDTMGRATWIRPLQGSKTWVMPQDKGVNSVLRLFCRFQHDIHPDWLEYRSFVLSSEVDSNGHWIQSPGQLHAVFTNAASFFVGGHFYTASTLHETIHALTYQLFYSAGTNEPVDDASLASLVRIFRHLDDDTLFTDYQRSRIVRSAELFFDEYNTLNENQDQAKEVLPEDFKFKQLKEFAEVLRAWMDKWRKIEIKKQKALLAELKK